MRENESLKMQKCVPCRQGTAPLQGAELEELYEQLQEGWKVVEEHHLEKEYLFSNFRQALDFANRIGALAEEEGHHPDLLVTYGKVKVILWTHKIDGLSKSDFILAAKCDQIL